MTRILKRITHLQRGAVDVLLPAAPVQKRKFQQHRHVIVDLFYGHIIGFETQILHPVVCRERVKSQRMLDLELAGRPQPDVIISQAIVRSDEKSVSEPIEFVSSGDRCLERCPSAVTARA